MRESRADKLVQISAENVRQQQLGRLCPQEFHALRERTIVRETPAASQSLLHAKEHLVERRSVVHDHELLTEALRHGRGNIELQLHLLPDRQMLFRFTKYIDWSIYVPMEITKGAQTRSSIVESMLELLQVNGYSGTGLNAVNEHAGTPKGSLYFHFPEGKEALGQAAVELAATRYTTMIQEVAAQAKTPGEFITSVIEVLAVMVTESDFQLGCPVSVVALEMSTGSERLRTACVTAYQSWIDALKTYLVAHGHSARAAHALSTTVVSTVEGAIIISRARRDAEPVRLAAKVLSPLLDGVVAVDPPKRTAR